MSQVATSPQHAYDTIADQYDDLWSRYVRGPQERLTDALGLQPGARLADLACGTGVDTLAMGRRVAPGEIVGVDPSEGMLREARRRAEAEGLKLLTVCAAAEAFLEQAPAASFDVISLRFGLAYLEWRTVLPTLARILRPGGRVGILTSVSTSVPQAWATYTEMAEELGFSRAQPNTPSTLEDVVAALGPGFEPQSTWIDRFRLRFDTGPAAARWLRESGYAVHPALQEIDPETLEFLTEAFGRRLEQRFGSDGVVPLDFEVAGIVAARR